MRIQTLTAALLAMSLAHASAAEQRVDESRSALASNDKVSAPAPRAGAMARTCKQVPMPGSRLKQERCMTRAQWAALRQIVRFDLQPAHWVR